ncbi:LOW QUALITY PROTEIN: hypothetical protein V2J09_016413 [Rumex salicifolius]
MYELQNDWIKSIKSIREKWAMMHGKVTFSADKTTTQRISYKGNLRRFFDNFQRLHDDNRYDEMVVDFKTSQSKVVLAFHVKILKHVASIYTPMVYKLLLLNVDFSRRLSEHPNPCRQRRIAGDSIGDWSAGEGGLQNDFLQQREIAFNYMARHAGGHEHLGFSHISRIFWELSIVRQSNQVRQVVRWSTCKERNKKTQVPFMLFKWTNMT